MANVFIIYGRSGEYADFSEWDVVAFLEQDKAVSFMQKLNSTLEKYGANRACSNAVRDNSEMFDEMSDLDPRFQIDYTGTNYRIRPLELVD